MNEVRTSSRKTRVGKVVSDKMDKTVVVAVADRVAHPLYKKIVGRTYKLKAHDENNACGIGDTVKVMETRPHLLMQLPVLITGMICYGVLVLLSYQISAKRFEKVDL